MNELREGIARLIWADGTGDDNDFGWHPRDGVCYKVADQILALLEPQMLTPDEAEAHLMMIEQEKAKYEQEREAYEEDMQSRQMDTNDGWRYA